MICSAMKLICVKLKIDLPHILRKCLRWNSNSRFLCETRRRHREIQLTHTKMLTIEMINEAATRIRGSVHRTPVITSGSFNEATGKEVFFKCENFQRAGA